VHENASFQNKILNEFFEEGLWRGKVSTKASANNSRFCPIQQTGHMVVKSENHMII